MPLRQPLHRRLRRGVGRHAALLLCQLIEPKLMIEPPPAARIIGATAWMAKN